jgi:hypothetical protein
MAIVHGPLMSMDASGTVGDTMTFAKWKGRNYVRNRVIPANPKTAGQLGIRAMLKFLGQAWAALTAQNKASFEAGAIAKSISAFNQYMSVNMARWRDSLLPAQNDVAAKAHTPSAVSQMTLTGGNGSVNVAITIATAVNQWGVIIFRDLAAITALNRSKAVAVIPVSDQTSLNFLDSGLEPGTYHYRAVAITDDGVQGTAIADATAVVT